MVVQYYRSFTVVARGGEDTCAYVGRGAGAGTHAPVVAMSPLFAAR